MKRYILLLPLIVGCGQPITAPPPGDPVEVGEEIDFANWQKAGQNPILVPGRVIAECVPQPAAVAYDPSKPREGGPHARPAIVVRVNPIGFDAFRNGQFPLPVGTVIVKEKHGSLSAQDKPNEYGAMVKREPGYDPTRGDWEYVYVVREPEKKVTRGQIESCIYCHVRQMDQDYTFRTYLK